MRLNAVCVLALLFCGASAASDVTLGKPAQRRAGLRTALAVASTPTVQLPARVLADARRTLHIAALQSGLIEAPAAGLPQPGQHVEAGTVLAWLTPGLSQPDRRDLGVELAASDRDAALGKMQLERFGIKDAKQFDVQLPTPTAVIVADYRAATGRSSAYRGALQQRIPLLATHAGTVLRTGSSAGQVAREGELLFELAAPGALTVEVLFSDTDLDPAAVVEAHTLDGKVLPVTLLAQTPDAALRSTRALYALTDAAAVRVQQPLLINVPRRSHSAPDFTAPRASIFTRDGAHWLWLHTGGEQFIARAVTLRAAEGAVGSTVQISSGVQAGERIVTAGAAALTALWSATP